MRLINADALDSVVSDLNKNHNFCVTRAEYKRIDSVLFEFPTIEPERKTGRWIVDRVGRIRCSACGEPDRCGVVPTRYCPNCGAKMEVEHERMY